MGFFNNPPPPNRKTPEENKEEVTMELDEEGVAWVKCANEGIRVSLQHMQLGQVVIDGANLIKLVSDQSEIQTPVV